MNLQTRLVLAWERLHIAFDSIGLRDFMLHLVCRHIVIYHYRPQIGPHHRLCYHRVFFMCSYHCSTYIHSKAGDGTISQSSKLSISAWPIKDCVSVREPSPLLDYFTVFDGVPYSRLEMSKQCWVCTSVALDLSQVGFLQHDGALFVQARLRKRRHHVSGFPYQRLKCKTTLSRAAVGTQYYVSFEDCRSPFSDLHIRPRVSSSVSLPGHLN